MNWSTFSHAMCTDVWKGFKAYRREHATTSFDQWAVKVSTKIANPEDRFVFLTSANAVRSLRIQGCSHYFIDSAVSEFAQQSVKDFSEVYRDDAFFSSLPIALHFPCTERRNSWVLLPDCDPYLFSIVGPEIGSFRVNRTGQGQVHSIDGVDGTELETVQSKFDSIWRLLFGLSLYVRAFPECVNEMQTNPMPWLQGARRMIGRHAIIEEEESRSVSPHFRRGHFRVLKSERYHEPGRVVFVKGTFVKGRAYHVEAPDVCAAA